MLNETNNRILVVDDNPAIHEDFNRLLGAKQSNERELDWIKAELLGEETPDDTATWFQIDSAFQGKEGLAKVQRAIDDARPYALAFVDIRMPPGWHGVKTVEHLWQVDPDLEVVICSAYTDYCRDEILDQLGQTDRLLVLKKPFRSVELIQIAHNLTQKWAQLRSDELNNLVQERAQELETAIKDLADDVSERHDMKAEIRLAQKLEAIGQLAAGIADEINPSLQQVGDHGICRNCKGLRQASSLARLVRSVALPDPKAG